MLPSVTESGSAVALVAVKQMLTGATGEESGRNLLLPMDIHYCTNFILGLYAGKIIDIVGYLAIGYLMLAII